MLKPKLEDVIKEELKTALNGTSWKKHFCQRGNGKIIDYYYTEGMMKGITDGIQYGVFTSASMTNKCLREVLENNLQQIAQFAKSKQTHLTISTIHDRIIGYIVEYKNGKKVWSEPTNETSTLIVKSKNPNTSFGLFVCDFKPVSDYIVDEEDF